MAKHLPSAASCPFCGSRPDVDRCEPWPSGLGPAPYYVGCYRGGDAEYFIGVNANTLLQAILDWNAEVERHG